MRFVWRHSGAITRILFTLGIVAPIGMGLILSRRPAPSAADHAALARLVDMTPTGSIRPRPHPHAHRP